MALITRSGRGYQGSEPTNLAHSPPLLGQNEHPFTVPTSPEHQHPSTVPTVPTSPSNESSDSDSDDFSAYIQLPSTYIHSKKLPAMATVKHAITKHCPIVTGGDLTLQILLLTENTFNKFFIAKAIVKEEGVKVILGAFKDVHIRDWITTDCECLLKLTFLEFMAELHTNFLPSDWVESICISLLGMRMTRNTRFWNFAQEVRALNIVLRGTPSHLGDSALQNQLKAGLEASLQSECTRKELYKLSTPKEWIEQVWKIDERLSIEQKKYQDIFNEESNLCASKHSVLGTSCIPNTSNNNNTSSSSTSKPFICLPKLTNAKKDLLCTHAGCFKCRQFNAGHNSSSPLCTGFSSGSGYKVITKHADAAGNVATKPILNLKNKVVASTIEKVELDKEEVVMAFAPSSMLGNGTNSGESNSVSDITPWKCKHFVWNCFTDGPLTEFPLKVSSLVDNRCYLVLIQPDIVEQLGLLILQLKNPETIDVAIKDWKMEEKMILDTFVILHATSLDQQWTSKCVHAIVTPNLCMPIIFSLSFLMHNDIVTDHAACSCVDKKSGYSLMNPLPMLTPPQKLSPKEKRTKLRKQKRNLVNELKEMCQEHLKSIEGTFENIKEIDLVGAIRAHINTLALQDSLQKEENKLRMEFGDLFQPIPYVDELPTDFMAEIKLKDPNLNVKNCSYACPHKYWAAWQTLLNQHLAARRIHPSSSLHASPAFIIPKSDPNALPHWVNDYRQLNANMVIDSHPFPWVDDILNDCVKGMYFSMIDMTNSFFKTRMKPEDIHLTVVSTPFGLYPSEKSNSCIARFAGKDLSYLSLWYYHMVNWPTNADCILMSSVWSITMSKTLH
jgi:hypothetical protein